MEDDYVYDDMFVRDEDPIEYYDDRLPYEEDDIDEVILYEDDDEIYRRKEIRSRSRQEDYMSIMLGSRYEKDKVYEIPFYLKKKSQSELLEIGVENYLAYKGTIIGSAVVGRRTINQRNDNFQYYIVAAYCYYLLTNLNRGIMVTKMRRSLEEARLRNRKPKTNNKFVVGQNVSSEFLNVIKVLINEERLLHYPGLSVTKVLELDELGAF